VLLSAHFDRLLYWSASSVLYAPLPTRSPCLINWHTNLAKCHVTGAVPDFTHVAGPRTSRPNSLRYLIYLHPHTTQRHHAHITLHLASGIAAVFSSRQPKELLGKTIPGAQGQAQGRKGGRIVRFRRRQR